MNRLNLARLRERADLTPPALAALAGISATTVTRIERGVRGCSSETLRRIADVLADELEEDVGAVLKTLTDPQ